MSKSICAKCKNCHAEHYNDFYGSGAFRSCKLYKLEAVGVDRISGEKIYPYKDMFDRAKEYFAVYEWPKSYYKMNWWNKIWADKIKVFYRRCELINKDGNCKEFAHG